MTNSSCPVETARSPPSLFQNGNLVFQAHHVGWIVAGFFTSVAVVTSFWLVNKHLQWYTNKREQRYIVRLLFMVPIYAVISLASYLFWNHSTPLLLIRDCYESTVLTSFFYLLLTYLSPNQDDQRAIFMKVGLSRQADAAALARGEEPKKWMLPLGFIKAKPADGLYFLQIMKWAVLQYCVVRPLTTLVAVTLNYIGWYCDSSFSPRFGYLYITVIVSVSVSIAMYCLIQVYLPIAEHLAPHKPLLKLFSVKAVVFLTFWQATFLSGLSMFGVVKNTTYMTADDINIGIAALLETFEMMLFAFLHLRAFSYKPYRPFHDPRSKQPPPTPTPRLRSLGHVLDFRETFREIYAGWVYIMDKMRGREPAPDRSARRFAHYESAFGRTRPSNLPTSAGLVDPGQNDVEKGLLSGLPKETGEEIPSWLEPVGRGRREKSESLEVQIQRELERRGFGSEIPGRGHIGPPPDTHGAPYHKPQRSWWRGVYSRVSQSEPEPGDEPSSNLAPSTPSRQRKPKSKLHTRESKDIDADRRLLVEYDQHFDDPPPEPLLASYRSSRLQDRHQTPHREHLDTVAPLSVFTAHRSSHQIRKQKQRSFSNQTSAHPPFPTILDPLMSRSQPPATSAPLGSHINRSDSLLGRVFPPSSASSGDYSHGSGGQTSLPSVLSHTARARGPMILTVPPLLGEAAPTEQRKSLNHPAEFITPPAQQAPPARSEEVVHFPGTDLEIGVKDDHRSSHGSHFRETADHHVPDGRRPQTSSEHPTRPLGLRRSSAQVYSPGSPSHRGRRQSANVDAPQIPETSYNTRPASNGQTSRRQSAPLDASHHPQYPYREGVHRSRNSVDNTSSNTTQPSRSGTRHANKYPIAMPDNSLHLYGVPPPQLAYQGVPRPGAASPSANSFYTQQITRT